MLHTIQGLDKTQQGEARMGLITARAAGPQFAPDNAPAHIAAHKPVAPAFKL
jgi:hypothetical protein